MHETTAASEPTQALTAHGGWHAYVGSRTTVERAARGLGLSVYAIDPADGTWTTQQTITDLVNPSYLIVDEVRSLLYCVHGDREEISSFAIDPRTGDVRLLQTMSTGGRNPVHLAMAANRDQLFVANYATGSVATIGLDDAGLFEGTAKVTPLFGKVGPHRSEQNGCHPHHVVVAPGGEFLIIPDKGADCVHILRVGGEGLQHHGQLLCREGSGPRHLAFDEATGHAYLVNELHSTITTCRWDGAAGALEAIAINSALPVAYVGENRSAAIVVDSASRRLFVSNRGHESVCMFSIDDAGVLSPLKWIDARGMGPRFFTLDPAGTALVIANERSHSIVSVPLEANGQGGSAFELECGSPVCVAFARSN